MKTAHSSSPSKHGNREQAARAARNAVIQTLLFHVIIADRHQG